jgi:signal transduction histidine kinase
MHSDFSRHAGRSADHATASLVHDLGNYLQIAISALHIISRHADAAEPGRITQASARATDALERAGALLRLGTRGTDASELAQTDIRSCLDQLEPLLRHVCGPAIDLRVHIELVPRVRCVAAVLETALLNMALNARDAMPEGGVLTIMARVSEGPENPEIEILVTDTGTGMSPEILSRALDPHFTTKGDEGRRGMGLAGVKHHVENQGGRLSIASELGVGTAITMRLPMALWPLLG